MLSLLALLAAAPVAQKPIQVAPWKLSEDYYKNEIGADNEWKGKLVELTTVLHNFGRDNLGKIVAHVGAPPGGITAVVRADQSKAFGKLERGQLIALRCTVAGVSAGLPALDDCRLTWSGRKPEAEEPASPNLPLIAARSYEICMVQKFRRARPDLLLPDGGAVDRDLTNDAGSTFTSVQAAGMVRMDRINRKDLAQRQLKPLPCDHPLVVAIDLCDDVGSSVECKAPDIAEARKLTHHEMPEEGDELDD